MRNKAVAEEATTDHFHLTMHLVVPFPSDGQVPMFIATTQRHSNGYVVATGPLLAAPYMDTPWPMPDGDFSRYLMEVIDALATDGPHKGPDVVMGTGGRKMKVNLLPRPIVPPDPLW